MDGYEIMHYITSIFTMPMAVDTSYSIYPGSIYQEVEIETTYLFK